jgi:hypothetical protein
MIVTGNVLRFCLIEPIRALEHHAIFKRSTAPTVGSDRLKFTAVASKSIRDRRLTGARIPESKKEPAVLFFVDNLPATEVARLVGISLDSARAIRDREQKRILKIREALTREYERRRERELEVSYRRDAERQYRELWREILKKQKALKLPPSKANERRLLFGAP